MSIMPSYKDTSLRNPFQTISNSKFPKTIWDAFSWAQYLHDRFPTLGNAITKVVRYFAADIDVIASTDPQQTDNQRIHDCQQLLKQKYNLLSFIIRSGQQLATMGNLFVSAQRIFTRYLLCPQPQCSWVMAICKLRKGLDYQWTKGQFTGCCPKCHKKVVFKIHDNPQTDQMGRKVRFIIRSPRDMSIKYNQLTDDYMYLYKMPSHIKQGIVQGDQVYLKNTPQLYLKAAFTNDLIQFPAQRFFHTRIKPLSTMDRLYRGWGTPLFLSSFNNILRLAYLDKFNEAVATDYIAPVRMISPNPGNLAAGSDPNKMPMSGWAVRQFITEALKRTKDNPTSWVISPIPLQYQMLGGESKQMAPVQFMQWHLDRILQDASIPVELRQTTFQQIAPSMGLRMFQRQWIHFSQNQQHLLTWAADQICQAHSLQSYKVVLNKTSFVQDDMHKQVYMQLASGGVISQDTFLKTVGLDFKEEQHKKQEENQYMMESDMKAQGEQQAMQMGSSVVPPNGSVGIGAAQLNMEQVQQANMQGAGAPMGPQGAMAPAGPIPPEGGGMAMPFGTGNSQSASLDALYQQAEAKAQEIFQIGQMQGGGARMSALRQLKATDPTLHAQVKQILQNMDSQTASQAVAQSKMPQ